MFAPKGLNLALGLCVWTRSNYYNTWYILSMLIGWKSGTSTCRKLYSAEFSKQNIPQVNLVPRACDPWEGNEGSGIIRCRKPGILAKIELRIHFNGQSDSSLKRIIPEPSFPSQGSQARGTRLSTSILVPRALLTRGATRGSGQIHNRIPWKHGNRIYPVLEQ
jgi:hypothetical protein